MKTYTYKVVLSSVLGVVACLLLLAHDPLDLQIAPRKLFAQVVANSTSPIQTVSVGGDQFVETLGSGSSSGSDGTATLLMGPNVLIPYLIQIVAVLGFAYYYKTSVVDRLNFSTVQGARTSTAPYPGLFDCLYDLHTCLYAYCCVFNRSAHNLQAAGYLDYWPAFLVQICAAGGGCFSCLNAFFYLKVKGSLGLPEDQVTDIAKGCCCIPCSVGELGIEVDRRTGVKIECCAKVNHLHAPAQNASPQEQQTEFEGRQVV